MADDHNAGPLAVAVAVAVHDMQVMAMFASRACRSSVMIGKALSRDEMTKVRGTLSSAMSSAYRSKECTYM